MIFDVVFVNCKVRDTPTLPLGKNVFTLKMAFAPLYYTGELPTSIQKIFFKCFIDVVFVLFLIEGKCKVSLNQQHGIYDNGKALPQVYREKVLDLYHQGSTQRQISQDMRVSTGYVNKVVQFYEQSNSSLPAPGC